MKMKLLFGTSAIAAGLLISGATIRAQKTVDPDGTTPLHWAVHRNDLKGAADLVRAGADVNATNR
jgi:ankyrin repeat protein